MLYEAGLRQHMDHRTQRHERDLKQVQCDRAEELIRDGWNTEGGGRDARPLVGLSLPDAGALEGGYQTRFIRLSRSSGPLSTFQNVHSDFSRLRTP